MDERKRHEIRRALNFAGVTRMAAIEDDKKLYLTKFLEATHLAFGTSMAFTNFIRNLIKVQNIRTYICESRDCRFELMYKRLKEQAEFLIQFYTKKGKKNKRGPKITKNLKKLFDPKRIEDFRLVKNQLDIQGKINMLECQSLWKSIDARAMVISYQILSKAKNKDILAPEIEIMKEQLSKLLKKI